MTQSLIGVLLANSLLYFEHIGAVASLGTVQVALKLIDVLFGQVCAWDVSYADLFLTGGVGLVLGGNADFFWGFGLESAAVAGVEGVTQSTVSSKGSFSCVIHDCSSDTGQEKSSKSST